MKKFLIVFSLIFLFSLTGCGGTPNSYKNEIQTANQIQEQLIDSTPVPQIRTSIERANVSKRAEIFSSQNKVSYIYLINYGRIMAFYTVKGKVSSLHSYLFPSDKIVNKSGNTCNRTVDGDCYIVEAPDIDGTYGENVSGIFFFTTDGAYVEWNGEYMMSDQPLQLTDKPALIREIK